MRQNRTITDTISIFVIPIQEDVEIEATISYEDIGEGYYECNGYAGYDSNYQWVLIGCTILSHIATDEICNFIELHSDIIIEKVLKQN